MKFHVALVLTFLWSCQRTNSPFEFPPIKEPANNRTSPERIDLGEKLFFDPLLSSDSSISCGSCHQPNHAFSSPQPLTSGVHGSLAKRNVPVLINLAWSPYFMFEGGLPTLEKVSLSPIQDAMEMNLPFPELIERLKSHSEYPSLFKKAYGEGPTPSSVVRSLAAYQRSIQSTQTRWDQFVTGRVELFNDAEKKGWQLFMGKAKCFSCHPPPLFTDFQFHAILPYDGDDGRYRIDPRPAMKGAFKTPTLRQLAFSAPYFHRGTAVNLDEVLNAYASTQNSNANVRLSKEEKAQLIAFLLTLSR
jgi:cytochrome c peroxidase